MSANVHDMRGFFFLCISYFKSQWLVLLPNTLGIVETVSAMDTNIPYGLLYHCR